MLPENRLSTYVPKSLTTLASCWTLLILWTFLSVASLSGRADADSVGGRSPSFSHEAQSDAKTGWKIYVLKYQDPEDAANTIEARVAPAAGSNLYSLKVRGTELLVTPSDLSILPGFRYGIPVLYPTPNRIRDSHFAFDGHIFEFRANDGPHFIHGLVHSLKWEADPPSSDARATTLRTWLDWNPALPDYKLFPITHRISIVYCLEPDGIKLTFTVEDRDSKRLPFGLAIHPWFRILGSRAETFIHVPAQKHMEAEALLPTGNLTTLDGTPYDLRQPRSLDALDLDDVYWGMVPELPAGYQCRDQGANVSLAASSEFTHMVVYTPKRESYFCMENQTCSTDAHNLFAKGLQKEAHLLIAEKGKPITAWVEIKVKKQ